LRGIPPPYPPSSPLELITRWQGTRGGPQCLDRLAAKLSYSFLMLSC
jgi:hypothetical protein